MAWMTAAQALEVLQVRPQTLYANVSRGRVRAQPDPADSRRSLYSREDVLRMAGRSRGRRNWRISNCGHAGRGPDSGRKRPPDSSDRCCTC